MGNELPRRHNWWLVGISSFTTVLFAIQALFAYQALTIRRDSYYLVSLLVFASLTIFSLYAAIQGWRNALPGQRRMEEEPPTQEPPTQEP